MPALERRARLNLPDVSPPISEEHAASIGYVAIQWAAVEEAVAFLVVPLLNTHLLAAHAITASQPELAALNLVTLLINLAGSREIESAWQKLLQRHEELRPQRNDAVHAKWRVVGETHAAYRIKAKKELRRSTKNVEIDRLNALADEILVLAEDLISFASILMKRQVHKSILSDNPPGLTVTADSYRTSNSITAKSSQGRRSHKIGAEARRSPG